MAELLALRHPLEHRRDALEDVGVELEPVPAAVDLRLPATAPALRAAAEALEGALPVAPQSWAAAGDGRVHRLGPDQWLTTADDRSGHDAAARERSLRDALRPHGGTATDVTATRVALRVAGDRARELLSFGCSLDLRRLAPGSCAQTLVWQSPTLLVVDDDGLRLLVRTSFADHLVARLLDAARSL
jgi:sarcosine oxidase, subunit gamma